MAEAARTLDLLGAKPTEGEENAASRWRDTGRAGGVSDAARTYRGRALGPAYRQGVLAPRATLATEQIFLAGKKAMVSVVPEAGRTADDARHRTGRGDLRAGRRSTARVCSWLPVFTRVGSRFGWSIRATGPRIIIWSATDASAMAPRGWPE